MSLIELLILAVALSMDAFAVSVCLGLSVQKAEAKHFLLPALYFGLFQAIMPLIGYFAGNAFWELIKGYTNIIAFALLLLIGLNMIREAIFDDCDDEIKNDFSNRALFLLAVATSIDALSVGFTFALLRVDIIKSVIIIGLTTFLISAFGVFVGNMFGSKYRKGAAIIGGIILILIGLKVLFKI